MAFVGRELKFSWDSTTLAGVRTRGVTMNNDLIDVTSDDSNGWQTLLAIPGVKSVEITIGGITENEVLINEFFKANPTGEALQATLPTSLSNAGNYSGTFMVSSLETSGEHSGELEFTATFMSSGPVTYVASSA